MSLFAEAVFTDVEQFECGVAGFSDLDFFGVIGDASSDEITLLEVECADRLRTGAGGGAFAVGVVGDTCAHERTVVEFDFAASALPIAVLVGVACGGALLQVGVADSGFTLSGVGLSGVTSLTNVDSILCGAKAEVGDLCTLDVDATDGAL